MDYELTQEILARDETKEFIDLFNPLELKDLLLYKFMGDEKVLQRLEKKPEILPAIIQGRMLNMKAARDFTINKVLKQIHHSYSLSKFEEAGSFVHIANKYQQQAELLSEDLLTEDRKDQLRVFFKQENKKQKNSLDDLVKQNLLPSKKGKKKSLREISAQHFDIMQTLNKYQLDIVSTKKTIEALRYTGMSEKDVKTQLDKKNGLVKDPYLYSLMKKKVNLDILHFSGKTGEKYSHLQLGIKEKESLATNVALAYYKAQRDAHSKLGHLKHGDRYLVDKDSGNKVFYESFNTKGKIHLLLHDGKFEVKDIARAELGVHDFVRNEDVNRYDESSILGKIKKYLIQTSKEVHVVRFDNNYDPDSKKPNSYVFTIVPSDQAIDSGAVSFPCPTLLVEDAIKKEHFRSSFHVKTYADTLSYHHNVDAHQLYKNATQQEIDSLSKSEGKKYDAIYKTVLSLLE